MACRSPASLSRMLLAAVLLCTTLMASRALGTHHLSASASAVEYWEQLFPNVPLPAQLRQRVSPLAVSPELITHYKAIISSGRAAVQPTGLCAAGHLYCSASQFAELRRVLPTCNVRSGFRLPVYETDAHGQQRLMRSQGDFFKESALVEGAYLVLRDQKDRSPTTSFLPRELAEMFQPLNAQLLEAAFGIPASSLLSKESIHTSHMCKANAEELLPGEEAFCALSLEDLADQLKARVVEASRSSSLRLLPVSGGAGASILQAKLLKVELQVEVAQPYLTCHAKTYPFAAHFCHHIPDTRIYSATLQSTSTHPAQLIHAVAICHMDTSAWSPLHVAFGDLHSTPGRTEACHWTHENGLIFVPTK